MSSPAQERRSGVQLLSAALPLLLLSLSGKKPDSQADRCLHTLIRGINSSMGRSVPAHCSIFKAVPLSADCVCACACVQDNGCNVK